MSEPLGSSLLLPRSEFRLTWSDLNDIDVQESPMLWEGFLPNREIALLAGVGGYGKSTLVRQLSMAITAGESTFLGRRLNPVHRRVIYVSCEDGAKKTARIVQKQRTKGSPGLVFVFASQLSLGEAIEEINQEMYLDSGTDMIVIDSLGNLFEGDQNSNSDAQKFYSKFSWFAEHSLVLFLHHVRKSNHASTPDQVNIQGAGAFVQRARAVLMLTGDRHDTDRYLHMEKENDVSDEFKYDALVLDFNLKQKLYSSDGETKPISEINRPVQPLTDLGSLFREGETELSAGDLVTRIMIKFSIKKRAAKERLKASGLTKVRHGWYARPSAESTKVQKVQSARSAESAVD